MLWKAVCLAGVCLSAFAAFLGGATDFIADRAARQAFDAIAAHAQALKADRIVADPSRGEIRVAGLSWDEAGVSVHIGALRLAAEPVAFSVSAAALAQAAAASAEDVTVKTALATVKISRIDLAGTFLSAVELAQILDAKSAMTIGDRIAKISAAAITIPELITETKLGSLAQKVVYRNISLTGVVKGKAAAASAEGASFSVSDPEAGDTEGAYGHLTAKAVDLVLAARIMSGTQDDPAEPKTALYDSFSVEGFHLSNATAHFDLGVKAMSGRGVKGRPLRMALAGAPEDDQTSRERKKRIALLYADVLESIAIDGMDASDVRLVVHGAQEPVSLSIDHVSMTQFSGMEIGGFALQNFALASESAKIGIEGFSLRKLDLGRLREALAKASASDEDAARSANVGAAMPAVEEMVLTKLDVDFVETKTGREGARGVFSAGRLEIRESSQKDGAPIQMDAKLEHFTRALDQDDGGAFKDLSDMGYSQLDLSSRIAMTWDEAKQELAIGTMSLEGADMGAIQISGLFSNITKDILSPNREVATVAALGALLKKIDVRIENTGFFERAIAAQAERQNKSAGALRQTYARAAIAFLPALLDNGPEAKAIGSAVAKFVVQPRSLHLVVVAPDGLGLSDLTSIQAPGALLKKLDIKAAANE
ncbi:hypothetical protein RZS28_16945 [Methylocapsa polymorpha]|uniref:AsmA family protein n=1 Tax=Methylocapsa polymorpha TaxID=3080828 RepID=A0ABZ0HSC3_9HYPH|nr:hypothetical protein RZS28_16945 [Methylocapsa sp. RX1]